MIHQGCTNKNLNHFSLSLLLKNIKKSLNYRIFIEKIHNNYVFNNITYSFTLLGIMFWCLLLLSDYKTPNKRYLFEKASEKKKKFKQTSR